MINFCMCVCVSGNSIEVVVIPRSMLIHDQLIQVFFRIYIFNYLTTTIEHKHYILHELFDDWTYLFA